MGRIEELEARLPRTADEWSAAMHNSVRREELHAICGPRAIASDLLLRIERATPHPPGTAEDVRAWLLAAVRQQPFSGRIERRGGVAIVSEPSPGQLAARSTEADRFEAHLLSLTTEQLVATEPLPYRRALAEEEGDRIRQELKARWDTRTNSWYPSANPDFQGSTIHLREFEPDPPRAMLHLRRSFVRRPSVLDALRRALARQGVTRLWELPLDPSDPCREMDLELFDPICPLSWDVFWCSAALDWVIFGSHEAMITLGGEELIRHFKQRVPEWPDGVWASIEDASR